MFRASAVLTVGLPFIAGSRSPTQSKYLILASQSFHARNQDSKNLFLLFFGKKHVLVALSWQGVVLQSSFVVAGCGSAYSAKTMVFNAGRS